MKVCRFCVSFRMDATIAVRLGRAGPHLVLAAGPNSVPSASGVGVGIVVSLRRLIPGPRVEEGPFEAPGLVKVRLFEGVQIWSERTSLVLDRAPAQRDLYAGCTVLFQLSADGEDSRFRWAVEAICAAHGPTAVAHGSPVIVRT